MKIPATILLLTLSGCAAIMSGSKQSVTVLTPGAEGSKCSLTDSKGREWHIDSTPGNAVVKKGDGPISVICKKEGFETGVGKIEESVVPAVAGNILFPLGFFVDSATGSGEKYETTTTIEMERVSTGGRKPWE